MEEAGCAYALSTEQNTSINGKGEIYEFQTN